MTIASPLPSEVDVCIAGGGPAGMMAGLLFARAGLTTLVLEKHGDFLRDFRGDTVHPATLELFAELGLGDALLARPHDKVSNIHAQIGGHSFVVADFRHLPVAHPFIAMMPQWEFLDFVAGEAARFPTFRLEMNAEATGLTFAGDRVSGVRVKAGIVVHEIAARLVIAADGRRSILRQAADLPLTDLGAPMDVMWFRVPKRDTPENQTTGIFGRGHIGALIDRGDYWQCAWVIAKGSSAAVEARGIAAFRAEVAAGAPQLAEGLAALTSFDDVSLLSVALDRLERWHRPGFLAIGDAAHAMSPVGGVGINLAVQDAVAAANILARPMLADANLDPLLAKVQARRLFPTRVIQRIQRAIHDRIIGRVLADASPPDPPLALRLIDRIGPLQRIPARIVGLGVRREHIRSPLSGGGRKRKLGGRA